MTQRLAMPHRPTLALLAFVCLLGLSLTGCSTAEASFAAGSGFSRTSSLALLDSTDTGKAIEAELFANGFNVIAGTKGGPAAQAEPQFIARAIVRRSWRGVIAGTVPGAITLTVSDAKTGAVVATASYDLGSMAYSNAHDAARILVAALASKVR